MRAALRSDGWRLIMIGAALLGAVIGAFIGKEPASQFALAIGCAIVLVGIVVVVIWVRAHGSAENDFMTAWGLTHELEFVEEPEIGTATPLLRLGDKRKSENGLVGALAGHPVTICHYTY